MLYVHLRLRFYPVSRFFWKIAILILMCVSSDFTFFLFFQFWGANADAKQDLRIFLFFPVLRLEVRAYTLSHSTSPIFCDGFFEIGSRKLFAWAGFEPPSS
jgi:hypothetical protein